VSANATYQIDEHHVITSTKTHAAREVAFARYTASVIWKGTAMRLSQSVNEELTGWPRCCVDKYHNAEKIFVLGIAGASRHEKQGVDPETRLYPRSSIDILKIAIGKTLGGKVRAWAHTI